MSNVIAFSQMVTEYFLGDTPNEASWQTLEGELKALECREPSQDQIFDQLSPNINNADFMGLAKEGLLYSIINLAIMPAINANSLRPLQDFYTVNHFLSNILNEVLDCFINENAELKALHGNLLNTLRLLLEIKKTNNYRVIRPIIIGKNNVAALIEKAKHFGVDHGYLERLLSKIVDHINSIQGDANMDDAAEAVIRECLRMHPHFEQNQVGFIPSAIRPHLFESQFPGQHETRLTLYDKMTFTKDSTNKLPLELFDYFSQQLKAYEQDCILKMSNTDIPDLHDSFQMQAKALSEQGKMGAYNPCLVLHFLMHGNKAITNQSTSLQALQTKHQTLKNKLNLMQWMSACHAGVGLILTIGILTHIASPTMPLLILMGSIGWLASQLILLAPTHLPSAHNIPIIQPWLLLNLGVVGLVVTINQLALAPLMLTLGLVGSLMPLIASSLRQYIAQNKANELTQTPDVIQCVKDHQLEGLFSIQDDCLALKVAETPLSL